MTETRTPRTDAHLNLYADPDKPVHSDWADFARELETDLQHLARVAEDALNFIGHSSNTPQKQKHKCWTALSEINRIKNQTK